MPDAKIIKPKALKTGDKIGIISPASKPLDEDQYFKGVKYLEDLGFSVIAGNSVLKQRGYLAGEDIERANDLNSMFANPEIKAIFCSRGGYGVPRILDKIDFEIIKNNPKIFSGYSDITALNLALWQKTGLVNFSGPMVAIEMGAGLNKFSENSLWQILLDTNNNRRLENPDDVKIRVIKHGKAEGRLIAGCFSVLNSILHTPYMPDLTGSILVIEDVEEEPYGIDRYFAQLKLSGILNSINGLVLGQFVDCVPTDKSKPTLTIDEIIDDYTNDLTIPVMANFAYGHIPVKLTLPIGVKVKLDTAEGCLTILEGTVEEY